MKESTESKQRTGKIANTKAPWISLSHESMEKNALNKNALAINVFVIIFKSFIFVMQSHTFYSIPFECFCSWIGSARPPAREMRCGDAISKFQGHFVYKKAILSQMRHTQRKNNIHSIWLLIIVIIAIITIIIIEIKRAKFRGCFFSTHSKV